VRREELARLGVQLPVLPTICLGALPGEASWALRLERLGLDVVGTGAAGDTVEGWLAARAAVPHRPVKGAGGADADAGALVAAGCVIVECEGAAPAGGYRLGPEEALAPGVDAGDPAVEDPNDVAARILAALARHPPAALWASAGPGLDALPAEAAEGKLRALAEGVRLARLVLAKEQFER
jgi:hypothetical protein